MLRPTVALLLVLAAACGGGRSSGAGGPAPVMASAADAVDDFMRAVADSNLARMGQLWGTARGPASVTGQPADWQRRIFVMQAWLKGGESRIIGNMIGSDGRRQVTIELLRGGCVKQVPFTVARMGSGSWVITAVDLEAAGNPARPCGVF